MYHLRTQVRGKDIFFTKNFMKVMSKQINDEEKRKKKINIINSEEGIARIFTDVFLIDSFDDSF